MRIIQLQAENVKRLVAVDITPEGHLVEVTGKNRNGKTSVLDSIWWALAGKGPIQAHPIRDGESKASITLTLGEPGKEKRLIVTRNFRLKTPAEGEAADPGEYTTTVTVENEDGMKAGKPQDTLDDLIGALSFDPLLFLKAEPKRQLVILRDLTGVDFTEIDAAIKDAFTKRTDVNRDASSLREQANALLVPEDAPTEAVNVDDLIQQLDDAGQTNADIQQTITSRKHRADGVSRIRDAADAHDREAEDLESRAAALRKLATEKREEADRTQKMLDEADPVPDPVDTAELRQKIADAQAANRVLETAERKKALTTRAVEKEAESKRLTAVIDAEKAKKTALIAEAKMPIEGLDFGEDGVLMNGQPFEQASDAEQLEASIAIAAAMNPKLRVIRVRDGSLLDSDAVARLAEFAEKHDLQVWMETVQSGRPGAVVMVNGQVEGDEPQPSLLPAD